MSDNTSGQTMKHPITSALGLILFGHGSVTEKEIMDVLIENKTTVKPLSFLYMKTCVPLKITVEVDQKLYDSSSTTKTGEEK